MIGNPVLALAVKASLIFTDDSDNPLDGVTPNDSGLGPEVQAKKNELLGVIWEWSLVIAVAAVIVSGSMLGWQRRNNAQGAGNGSKAFFVGSCVALFVVGAIKLITGGILNLAG